MISFWDPQSGTTYRLIDLKLVHFWSKTANLRSLRQKTHKQTHDPPAIAAPESSPKLLQTDKQPTTTFVTQANGSGAPRNKHGWMRLILFLHGSHMASSKISLHRGWRQFRVLNSAIFLPDETEDSLTSTF